MNLRYEGTDTSIMVNSWHQQEGFLENFYKNHKREFGFILEDRSILIDNIRVQSIGKPCITENSKILSDEDLKSQYEK